MRVLYNRTDEGLWITLTESWISGYISERRFDSDRPREQGVPSLILFPNDEKEEGGLVSLIEVELEYIKQALKSTDGLAMIRVRRLANLTRFLKDAEVYPNLVGFLEVEVRNIREKVRAYGEISRQTETYVNAFPTWKRRFIRLMVNGVVTARRKEAIETIDSVIDDLGDAI